MEYTISRRSRMSARLLKNLSNVEEPPVFCYCSTMCGIAGFVGEGDRALLERMHAAIAHRGPDDRGFLLRNSVGFAFARLSIQDTSPAGHQPMFSDDGDVAIIFNGEIYNFKKLRERFLAAGHRFKSGTDTEVILKLYEKDGEDVFSQIDGMFAIALYDFKKKALLLARDRLGKKPLYWTLSGGGLVFGSELSALTEHPSVKREIDLASLAKYFAYEYVPTPHTIYSNVHKLEPATVLRFSGGSVGKRSFWKLPFGEKERSQGDALRELDRLLGESVEKRLVADVPLGVFLSGGIDSATVAYYAKRAKPDIDTFSIGFSEKSYDESLHARAVADHLGTRHHEHIFTPEDAVAIAPEALGRLSEPLADDSIVPTYLLSRFARQDVTVALGGDGGDELFAGYPTFQAARLLPVVGALPAAVRAALESLVENLPASPAYFSLDFKLKKFMRGAMGAGPLHLRWLESFSAEERVRLFTPDVRRAAVNAYEDTERYLEEARDAAPLNRELYGYLRTYLMDGVLVKVDRASMARALEVRAPFLDHRLVEFAFSLDPAYKLRGFTTKYLLKKLMRDRLPPGVARRRKRGFALPVALFLRVGLKPYLEDMLSKERIERGGLFNYDYVRVLKEEHFAGVRNHRQKLWTLLTFEAWRERWARA